MKIEKREKAIIFLIGALGYGLIEIIWRGYTHFSMLLTGGFGFLVLHTVNLKLNIYNCLKKMLIGGLVLTLVELLSGCVFNKILRLNVWDYSKLRFNFKGQICLLYSFLWCMLCIPIFILSKILHKKLK